MTADRNDIAFRAAQRRYDNMLPPDEVIPHCPRCGDELDIADVRNGNTLCDECSEIRTREIAVKAAARNPFVPVKGRWL
jgi:hypothetical protein